MLPALRLATVAVTARARSAELAVEARAAVGAGAVLVHLHPYDDDGRQTFAAEPCAHAIRAVRAACPGIPISRAAPLRTSRQTPSGARR